MIPWANSSPQPKEHLDRFSRFVQLTAECPYTLQLAAPSPSKLPISVGIWTPSNTWFLGSTRVLYPNGITIGLAVFAGLTTVTDRQTDRPHYSVCSNRPHLIVLRCGLIIITYAQCGGRVSLGGVIPVYLTIQNRKKKKERLNTDGFSYEYTRVLRVPLPMTKGLSDVS